MEVNFFPIRFPNQEMPFWVGTRDKDQKLSSSERLLDPRSDDPVRRTVFVGEGAAGQGYEEMAFVPHDLPPGIVHAHLQVGLTAGFGELGYRTVPLQLGLRCFSVNDETRSKTVPEFIRVLQGVELRTDYMGVGPNRLYGCFVTPRALVEFRDGLADSSVSKAAEGHTVQFKNNESYNRGRLVAVDHERLLATIASGENEFEIALDDVVVPGDSKIVSRYCQLAGRQDEANRVYVAGQIANFRLSAQGKRNRRWLAQQYEYLRNWLLNVSKAGYMRFPWPRSDEQLTLDVRPVEAGKAA